MYSIRHRFYQRGEWNLSVSLSTSLALSRWGQPLSVRKVTEVPVLVVHLLVCITIILHRVIFRRTFLTIEIEKNFLKKRYVLRSFAFPYDKNNRLLKKQMVEVTFSSFSNTLSRRNVHMNESIVAGSIYLMVHRPNSYFIATIWDIWLFI